MTESSQATLAKLENVLAKNAASPKVVLETAYLLGKIDGQMEMAQVAEKALGQLKVVK